MQKSWKQPKVLLIIELIASMPNDEVKLLGAQKLLTLITLPLDIIRDHGYETQFL